MAGNSQPFNRPAGDITTLLDLTDRDAQDNAYFPLKADTSWFARSPDRRFTPFVPVLQDFQYRGPAGFGQRFSFDVTAQTCGDLLLGSVLQLQLTSWFDLTTVLNLQSQAYKYQTPQDAWYYANALGQIILEKVELEIDGTTIEQVDGDLATMFSVLYPDFNTQVGPGVDHLGTASLQQILDWPSYRVFPTESGYLQCLLPLFFQRSRMKEGLPLVACKEGSVHIHITLRPFTEVIRQARGFRDACDSTPINTTINLVNTSGPFDQVIPTQTQEAEPMLQNVRLVTWGAMIGGNVRSAMIRQPFEIMHRHIQTFSFQEPLKYVIAKPTQDNTIRIQLPLEANHPIEEVLWFVRRKDVNNNNEWTNWSSVLNKEWDATYNPRQSMMTYAVVQANGITVVEAEEQFFRQLIAKHHRGGIVAYNQFVYGYTFAKWPGDIHQPSGSINASRLQNFRLTLDIRPPRNTDGTSASWEVKVFCVGLNWLRFQNGIANRMFND